MKCLFPFMFLLLILVEFSSSFKQNDINLVDSSVDSSINKVPYIRIRRSPRGGHGRFGGGFGGGRGFGGFGGPGGKGIGGLGGRSFGGRSFGGLGSPGFGGLGSRGFGGGRPLFGGGAGIFPFVLYKTRRPYYGPFGSFYY